MLTSLHLHVKSSEVCIKTGSPSASLPMQDQVTKHTTVKEPIAGKAVIQASRVSVSGWVEVYCGMESGQQL